MENHLVLSTSGPWYELFYNIAFLTALGVLLYEAYKRKIPIMKWVVLIIITRILFIAGTKLITFRVQEWYELFTQFRMPSAPGKSLLGGLLFGFAGLAGGWYLLKFRNNVTDAFAMVLPIGIAIQRLGCFFTGCCYGKTSSLPWAVQYPVNTLPHYHQFEAGILSWQDSVSLTIHPVQLYEAAGMIAAVVLIWYFAKRLKKPGNLLILSVILMLTVRIIFEFFRDVNAHTIGGKMTGVFNTTQLVLVPIVITLFLIMVLREKSAIQASVRIKEIDLSPHRAFILLGLLLMLFLMFRSWFDLTERVVMLATFLVAFAIPGYKLYQLFSRERYRWLYPAFLILPFFLLSQTYKEDVRDSVLVKKYKTLKVGFGHGNIDNSNTYSTGTGCDAISNSEYFQQKYNLGAIAFEYTHEQPDMMKKLSYGVNAVIGNHEEFRISDSYRKDFNLFDVNPYVKFESNWFGVGGGLHVGNLNFILENKSTEKTGIPETGNITSPVYPQAYLRFGPVRYIFMDYRLADHFPSAMPGLRHQLGIGSGLGLSNFTSVRIGSNLGNAGYLSGYVPVKSFVIEPMLQWQKSSIDYNKSRYQFSVGLGYRFGMKDQVLPKTDY